jgi:hypothetical protein
MGGGRGPPMTSGRSEGTPGHWIARQADDKPALLGRISCKRVGLIQGQPGAFRH